jgi:hypothetical protein
VTPVTERGVDTLPARGDHQKAARHPARRTRAVRLPFACGGGGDCRRGPGGGSPGRETGAARRGGRRRRRRGSASVRIARGDQAGERAQDVRPRSRRAPGTRCGRCHRGLHRLPAPARGRRGRRARRRVRRAGLADPNRPASDRPGAPQRPLAGPRRAALRAGPDRRRPVVHLAHEGAPRGPVRGGASLRLPRAGEASVRGRSGTGGEGGRGALVGEHARTRLAAAVLGYASSGLPGPAGNRESFVWLAEAGRAGAVEDLEAAVRRAEP